MNKPIARIFLLYAFCGPVFYSCHKNPPATGQVVARGNRHLGAHLSVAVNSTYPAAYDKARTAGADCIPFTLQWAALESNGLYDSAGLLGDLNNFYSGKPVSLSLCVSPFAADHRDLPADLAAAPFDDAGMIGRFTMLLDSIHARLPGVNLRYLLIGNEADLYLAAHPSEWNAYGKFCRAVRLHAQELWGTNLQTGAETTLGAAIGPLRAGVKALQDSMDMLCLTYYPLRADFFMEPSSRANADFDTLFSLYPSRPLLFQEIGYATGPACGGSDSAQVNFVRTVFRLWDRHPDQISYMAFLWLNDLPDSEAEQVTRDYGLSGTAAAPAFTEYIRTLGLCDETGNAKPGFLRLQEEALKRGWAD